MSDLDKRIYQAVSQIPEGTTATYGDIAQAVGTHPRVVGNAVHRNPNPNAIPCHRVVTQTGKLSASFAFGGAAGQARRLAREGVRTKNGRLRPPSRKRL